jgi:hypothetical protein
LQALWRATAGAAGGEPPPFASEAWKAWLLAELARPRDPSRVLAGLPPEADTSAAKELMKDGEQSGLLKADTVEKTAKVSAISPRQGEATLLFADGTTRNITVRRDVNLWNEKVGEEVVIRTRSAVVLNLEKP